MIAAQGGDLDHSECGMHVSGELSRPSSKSCRHGGCSDDKGDDAVITCASDLRVLPADDRVIS
jgi:hypothetical protein